MSAPRQTIGTVVGVILFFFALPAHAETIEFRIAAWNMESGDSSDTLLKSQLGAKKGIEIWGLSEVRNNTAAQAFEEGAEIGESSNFETILRTTGGGDRLAIIYNADRLTLIGHEELTVGLFRRHRAPLVAHFRGNSTGTEFKVMVNHLARGDANARHDQANFLNTWVQSETLPIAAVGDFNFDYHVTFGDGGNRDQGFDNMIKDGHWIWLKPEPLLKTQASRRFNSVLDFVFVANPPSNWAGKSTILKRAGDEPATARGFDDSSDETDHRPVDAMVEFTLLPGEDGDDDDGGPSTTEISQIIERLDKLEAQIRALRDALHQ